MSETWLSPAEVFDLTDRKRWQAQCRAQKVHIWPIVRLIGQIRAV